MRFVVARNAAWDCATGNGQAAVLLAEHFELVQATDISEKQIANAQRHPRISYSIASGENSLFPDQSFDLITVAQAYHWFNFEAFESEAKRVLKPDGILAVWGYGLITCDDDSLNNLIKFFYENVVDPYWDPERKYVDEHYRTIPFPFDELPGKEFFIEQSWNLDDLSGYFNTWSSVQHFIADKGFNPVDELKSDLQKVWPAKETLLFQFPLFLRLGGLLKE
jgi:ubiquinone/menaquinone biosynthesis C-methylase UbiE